MTRTYEFNISRGVIAPDGYQKSVLLVNEQFPGPLVEANWGDWIEVKVNNYITDDPPEGTAIHWHGFLQHGSPWMDGTPGVSQCPIAPGKSFTYKFRADIHGTTWYHSHYSAQYSGGLYGPMVIHGPSNVKYDVDVGPIMVNGACSCTPGRASFLPGRLTLIFTWQTGGTRTISRSSKK